MWRTSLKTSSNFKIDNTRQPLKLNNKVNRKTFMAILVTALWLANGLFCCCCENLLAGEPVAGAISSCPDEPSYPTPEGEAGDCGLCCGHQVFTSFPPQDFQVAKPAQEQVNPENVLFSNQLHLISIYHPPRF